jgi:hypothetical protein
VKLTGRVYTVSTTPERVHGIDAGGPIRGTEARGDRGADEHDRDDEVRQRIEGTDTEEK